MISKSRRAIELNVKPKRQVESEILKPAGVDDQIVDKFAVLSALIGVRKQAGITQADVATRMSIKPSALSRLEQGVASRKHDPTLATLRRYAEAVGVDLRVRLVLRRKNLGSDPDVAQTPAGPFVAEVLPVVVEESRDGGGQSDRPVEPCFPESELSKRWSHDLRTREALEDLRESGWSEQSISSLAILVDAAKGLAVVEKDDLVNRTPTSRNPKFRKMFDTCCSQLQGAIDDLGERWKEVASELLRSHNNESRCAGQLLLHIKGLPMDVDPTDFLLPDSFGQPLLALGQAVRGAHFKKSAIRRDEKFVRRRLVRFVWRVLDGETKHCARTTAALVSVALDDTEVSAESVRETLADRPLKRKLRSTATDNSA